MKIKARLQRVDCAPYSYNASREFCFRFISSFKFKMNRISWELKRAELCVKNYAWHHTQIAHRLYAIHSGAFVILRDTQWKDILCIEMWKESNPHQKFKVLPLNASCNSWWLFCNIVRRGNICKWVAQQGCKYVKRLSVCKGNSQAISVPLSSVCRQKQMKCINAWQSFDERRTCI